MLNVGQSCFLLVPNEQNKRILLPGTVLRVGSNNEAAARFEGQAPLVASSEATIFAEFRGKFLQQAITVSSVGVDGAQDVIEFTRIGEPVAADGRQSFRISVATAGIFASVDKQLKCHVVDISPEGCAVICGSPLTVGQTVNISFSFEGTTVEGPMKVQTVKQLDSGKTRFGLLATSKNSLSRRGLEKLSIQMQRLQLKRLAGAA